MKRAEAEHVLRAAAAIAQEQTFVVVGSQSILFMLTQVPDALLVSRELDLYPSMHPEKADLIDGAIGALSSFDETFGYHADGVGPGTAVMPADWMSRASLHYIGDVTVICPDIHDLALSKAVAGRDKDADFVRELFRLRLADPLIVRQRALMLDAAQATAAPLLTWIDRRRLEALNTP